MLMQKWKFTCVFLVVATFGIKNASGQNPALIDAYINEYKDMAMAEQMRVGIPAAITLAQGIHETGAGTSELAVKGNNHFGIKCKRGWTGQTMKHTDDRPNECFRKYSSAGASYKDHSDYLKNNPRYASLFTLSTTDYAAWAIGLRRAGYATNPKYAQMLIKLIEDYKLQEYTYAAMDNNPYSDKKFAKNAGEVVPNDDNGNNTVVAKPKAPITTTAVAKPPAPTVVRKTVSNSGVQVEQQVPAADSPAYRKEVKVNGLRAVYARKGESPLEYAIRNSIRYNKFLEINDLKDEPLPADMYLYLERKHFKGTRPMHMVKPGETMLMVAQAEGVQLRSLLELNLLAKGEEALPGTTLELQRKATTKPKTWTALKDEDVADNDSGTKTSSPKVQQGTEYVSTNKANVANTKMAIDYVHPNATTTKPSVTAPASKTAAVKPAVAPPAPAYAVDSQQMELNDLKSKFDKVLYVDNDTKPVTTPVAKTTTKQAAVKDTVAKVVQQPQVQIKKDDNAKVMQMPVVATTTKSTTTPPPVAKTTIIKQAAVKDTVTKVVQQSQDKVGDNDNVLQVPVVATTTKNTTPPTTPVAKNDDNFVQTRKVKPITRVVVDGDTVAKSVDKPVEEKAVDAVGDNAVAKQDKVTKSLPLDPPPVAQVVDTPKTELDRLKQQFDQAIYNDGAAKAKPTAPKAKTNISTLANNAGVPAADPSKLYVVKKGDTAFSIAKKHNITMSQLMDWNDLDFGPIKEGMKLKVKE